MRSLSLRCWIFRLFVLAVVSFGTHATALHAQGPRLDPPPCTGGGCELEIRQSLFSTRIARVRDSVAPRIGLTGASVVRAVSGVREAEFEAQVGRRQKLRGHAAAGASLLLLAGAWLGVGSENNGVFFASLAAMPASIGATFYSVYEQRQSMQTFERAVWMYNRSLRPATPRR